MSRFTLTEERFGSMTSKLRTYLRGLVRRRNSGVVSADDVHAFLDRQGVPRNAVSTRLRFVNTVFPSTFTYAGRTRSSRPVARGRVINLWTTTE